MQQPERRVAAMLERAVVLLVSNLRRHFINPCLRFAKQIMLSVRLKTCGVIGIICVSKEVV
jgi:hypothetical protein